MAISSSEIKFLIKLISTPSDKMNWYDIRNTKDGVGNKNLMSVIASRLKNGKKLLESFGNNYYRPTDEGWRLLKEFHDQIALPLTKIFSK